MNDVERYELAEKVLDFYRADREGALPTEEEVIKHFGDIEVSPEDQELVFKIVKDLMQHEQDITESEVEKSE